MHLSQCTKIATNNLMLKVISFMLGTAVWLHYSYQQPVRLHASVPVSFYNNEAERIMHAPEQITIELCAKRADLYCLDTHQLALHIDANQLRTGKQAVPVTHKQLFLPQSVKLVNYTPSNSFIEVEQL